MLPNGVLVVALTGPLTLDAMLYFKAEIVAHHGPQIRAFVVDFTKATIALTGQELDAVLDGEPEDAAPSMPAAMIVRPEQNSLFKGHALRMAGQHGITRRVFNCADPAMTWAQEAAARLSP